MPRITASRPVAVPHVSGASRAADATCPATRARAMIEDRVHAMKIKPIGKVTRGRSEESILELDPVYTDGLSGISAGDRVQVLYWMHRLGEGQKAILKVHPRGDQRRPLQGVFGLRSPMRPNPIGVSLVEVVRVEESQVFVKGLDALDGSPLIDLKGAPGHMCRGSERVIEDSGDM